MKDILANTSESVDQITIEPDGRWLPPGGSESGQSPDQSRSQDPIQDVLDDDDFFEISSVGLAGGRTGSHQALGLGTPKTFGVSATASYVGTPSFGTPSLATPKTTASPRPAPGSSNKRPAAEVIDLTLSDDDDEPSQPPPKRPNWGTNLSSSFPRK
jgi:E3 SUMO-protein ligase PIAS1